MALRSNFKIGSTQWAVRRAQWVSMGISEVDMLKPKIAVINSSSELSVCFSHLDGIAAVVKAAVKEAGGLPFEVRTVAPSDFVTSAGRSGRYLMPSRDLLVNDIEVTVEGAQLDGMVCLSSCDKTTPAHLMAAARLNIPTIVVTCGYQRHGAVGGDEVDIEDVFESVGAVSSGKMSLDRLCDMADAAICSAGVCTGMGTANTMHIASEALGMTLSGSTPAEATGEKTLKFADRAGRRIVEMVEEDLRPRDVMKQSAFENAVAACLAVSGSVNMVRHLQAVAVEAETDVDLYRIVDQIGSSTPLLCAPRPNGATRIEEFEQAGGTRAVLRQLGNLINADSLTVEGRPIGESLTDVKVDERVIHSAVQPLSAGPSLVLMRGSLAPEGGLFKVGAKRGDLKFEGPARVFDSQEEALDALSAEQIRTGDVVVLRGLGPVGGPGVASASWFVAALNGAGLANSVAVITDGQLSGLNHGVVVGQISPEAAVGGPLALVHSDDRISIDVRSQRVDLLIDEAEMKKRANEHIAHPLKPESGWLGMYQRLVEPLSRGAVLRR